MGKNLEHHSSSVSIENNHPGCMWSILHVLKYHHWRYIKKKLHHNSGGNRKHAKWDGNPGNISTDSKVGGTPRSNNTGNHHSTENSNDKRQKSVHVKGISTDASAQQSKEILDALDMINIDKDIFKIFLQDSTNPLAHYMHHHYTFTTKMGYSVSFPLAGSSYGIGSGARKGKQKQEGLEKLQAGSHTKKLC